jgi:hypothetical protein
MRTLCLAFAVPLACISACSLFLDTDSLQKGEPTTATGGSSGAAGSSMADASSEADSDAESGTKGCRSDFDCQGPQLDSCMVNKCGADDAGASQTCAAPTPYSGLAIAPEADVETLFQADEIGYPNLLADGTDIFLGVWARNGTATNIPLRRYSENPTLGATTTDLNGLTPGVFKGFGSSPGMFALALPRRLRLLLAADIAEASATGMYQVDLDAPGPNLNLRLDVKQPAVADLGVPGYDAKPRGPVPVMLPGFFAEPGGLWVQQDKLFHFDGTTASVAFSAKRVLSFAALAGYGGIHAVLETTALGGGQEATEVWSANTSPEGGAPSFTTLVGDQPGTLRRGVTAINTNEALVVSNFVFWSFEKGGIPSLQYAAAACVGDMCTVKGAPMLGSAPSYPAAFPESASARVNGSNVDRDAIVTYQVTVGDPDHPTMAITALIGAVTRLTTPQEAGMDFTSRPMNPASFVIAAATGPLSAPPGETLGPSSVAITSNGHIMVAWVERPMPGNAVLKTRRFVVKTCP